MGAAGKTDKLGSHKTRIMQTQQSGQQEKQFSTRLISQILRRRKASTLKIHQSNVFVFFSPKVGCAREMAQLDKSRLEA